MDGSMAVSLPYSIFCFALFTSFFILQAWDIPNKPKDSISFFSEHPACGTTTGTEESKEVYYIEKDMIPAIMIKTTIRNTYVPTQEHIHM